MHLTKIEDTSIRMLELAPGNNHSNSSGGSDEKHTSNGLLKAMLQHSMKARFSSTPLDPPPTSRSDNKLKGGAVDTGRHSSNFDGQGAAASAVENSLARITSLDEDSVYDNEDKKEDDGILLQRRRNNHKDGDGVAGKKIDTISPPSPSCIASIENHSSQNVSPVLSTEDLLLTASEREYLETLLRNGDPDDILMASQRLKDPNIFPFPQHEYAAQDSDVSLPEQSIPNDSSIAAGKKSDLQSYSNNQAPVADAVTSPSSEQQHPPALRRRNSKVQQHLFRLHETQAVQPSQALQLMSLVHRNSILESQDTEEEEYANGGVLRDFALRQTQKMVPAPRGQKPNEPRNGQARTLTQGDEDNLICDYPDNEDNTTEVDDFGVVDWDPFKDISSWLDGSQGVEVSDSGVPVAHGGKQSSASSNSGGVICRSLSSSSSSCPLSRSNGSGLGITGTVKPQHYHNHSNREPFLILGTAADDVSCHPHVMSPPLMESLLAFLPESLTQQQHNFWLKYSLVRDGANLWTLLKQSRASTHSILAVETVDGHVFGSFTSHSWRLAQGWYGGKDTFLWKMRKSRLETTKSIIQQACQESEIQVFPYRPGNVAIQYCSKECLMLGRGELLPTRAGGRHYGYAIHLEAGLTRGSTSNSETFGNPCLVDPEQRGARFDISNIELWALTPRKTVSEAEQTELSTLFLEGGRDGNDNLNFMRILVGGPI